MQFPAFTRSIRFRLTVWYSSLLLVFGVAFVLALNIAVRLDQPGTIYEGVQYNDIEWQPVRTGPGQAITGFVPRLRENVTLREAEDQIYSENIDRLRYLSLLSVVGLALASGVGGYVLSGMMLRPVRDITQAASEISATNLSRRINYQGPQDELSDLAQTFDLMIGRLEHSFERQRQFVQDASHELRTPLAAIRTNIEVTEMDPDATPEEYRDLLATIKTQTERLTRLSEDLLLLTNDDGANVEKEPVDLGELAMEVASQLGPLAAARRVTLVPLTGEPVEVETSPDLMYRCVLNLVDNAIKYSGEGSTVRLSVRALAGSGVVQVTDDGVGIEPEDLTRIFDRFYRTDKGRSRREGGTGLGLSIVKELVESLGGTVAAESVPGEGTTFTIVVPASAPSAPVRPRSTPQADPALTFEPRQS